MQREAPLSSGSNSVSQAFEHSITWEDDIWRADPVDVALVHAKGRARFADVLAGVTGLRGGPSQARILLFHGQSGAGKTHLLRALRTSAHRAGTAYFGYAQMTPDVSNYADYFLRRLINSLEKPYDPDGGSTSGLARLTDHLVTDAEWVDPGSLELLREGDLDDAALARLIVDLADRIVTSPRFAEHSLDVNVVRALLYLQRQDPRLDQRIRQYLNGKVLNELSQASVSALDPNAGDGRAFEIIESLGRLMWVVDRAAFVFAIDQVEDLRFFENYTDRFQKAVRDLIQIANRLPTSIILISVLGDFYEKVRDALAQSYIDRIEKAGPIPLVETRTADEARLIIQKRLEYGVTRGLDLGVTDPVQYFGPQFFEEFSGLSTRRLLELAQARCRERGEVAAADPANTDGAPGFMSALVAALGGGLFGAPAPAKSATTEPAGGAAVPAPGLDYRDLWERHNAASEADVTLDDQDMLANLLATSLALAREEWGDALDLTVEKLMFGDDLPALEMTLRHRSGFTSECRVFLCNRSTQGGAFKRQLDRALQSMGTRSCYMVRASDFPPNSKSQTSLAFRKFRESGGRSLLVPVAEWERMMILRDFHAQHRHDAGFNQWLEQAKLLSSLASIVQLLRLDLFQRNVQKVEGAAKVALESVMSAASVALAPGLVAAIGGASPRPPAQAVTEASSAPGSAASAAPLSPLVVPPPPALAPPPNADWLGWGRDAAPAGLGQTPPSLDPRTGEPNLSIEQILDEDGARRGSILAGRLIKTQKSVTLAKDVLKRHAAVLGGSGSGKTTLALNLIEQVLAQGIPTVLIDRKGDLCSYANPDVWRAIDGDGAERRGQREKLADSIDVAVYTPGRSSGRPVTITLLPSGINELPDHEQQLLANLSAAALGDMLHLKNSATHQKLSGTLSVALKLLGQRFSTQVMLADLIHMLEEDDPELADATQRMDPSGRLRRDLVAQLDSLRLRNSSLFEAGGETLSFERMIGRGSSGRDGRTRLSIVYTGFLGDNENILFWVSQFLSETLRFCQRNPADELQALLMLDEADLYIPANAKPATAEPLQSLLKRARSAGLGIMLATQSPGDLDYKSRDQITSWFIGRVREDTALRKLRAAFQADSGLDPVAALPHQTVGEFHLVQEGMVRAIKSGRSLIQAEQVPFERIEQLARETKGAEDLQLKFPL
jgi:RecA/RadA recombinase